MKTVNQVCIGIYFSLLLFSLEPMRMDEVSCSEQSKTNLLPSEANNSDFEEFDTIPEATESCSKHTTNSSDRVEAGSSR